MVLSLYRFPELIWCLGVYLFLLLRFLSLYGFLHVLVHCHRLTVTEGAGDPTDAPEVIEV